MPENNDASGSRSSDGHDSGADRSGSLRGDNTQRRYRNEENNRQNHKKGTHGIDEKSDKKEQHTLRRSAPQPSQLDRTEDFDRHEPYVSVTIEGEYTAVFERLNHPHGFQQNDLDILLENLESTLFAVVKTGGGIRSEIYKAASFELDDPWEIRKYLAVLEMHNLIHQRDDRWLPSDSVETP